MMNKGRFIAPGFTVNVTSLFLVFDVGEIRQRERRERLSDQETDKFQKRCHAFIIPFAKKKKRENDVLFLSLLNV